MTQLSRLPLVAVVTPVYNGAAYLEEALESVQAQTYPNVVHVVLDNASTDATADIIASFRDRKVPIITARNASLLPMDENWNASLKLIPPDAEYFRMLCADDAMLPDHLTRTVALAESDADISVVCTQVRHNEREEDFQWPADRNVFDGRTALQRYFTANGWIEARQALMRTAALGLAEPFFDLNTGHSSDVDAVLRLLTMGKFGFVHERLEMVREHPDTLSNSQMRPLHIHFNDWLITFLRYGRHAFGDVEYEKMLRRYRRFYFRRLIVWRYVHGNRRAFDTHMQLLEKIDSRPGPFDYLDAGVDLALKKIGLRPGWYPYPN